MELVEIESYNDGNNRERCMFRKLVIDFQNPADPALPAETPEILLIFTEKVDGPLARKPTQLTLTAVNSTRVPVVIRQADGTYAPKMIPSGQVDQAGNPVLVQETIGEFEMWKRLTNLTHFFEMAIRRRKGLDNSPLAFIEE